MKFPDFAKNTLVGLALTVSPGCQITNTNDINPKLETITTQTTEGLQSVMVKFDERDKETLATQECVSGEDVLHSDQWYKNAAEEYKSLHGSKDPEEPDGSVNLPQLVNF